jgi:elongation factor G
MVQGMEEQYGSQIIRADVPLAEMFGYATTLRSMSQGRATYTMEFHHFAEAPRNVADEIIARVRRVNELHGSPWATMCLSFVSSFT